MFKFKLRYLISGIIALYFIFVNTKFFPFGKEAIFFLALFIYFYFIVRDKKFYINYIVLYNTIFFILAFPFIVYWNISINEYLLFLYRKFQYIFMMFFPLIFFTFNKHINIIKYLSIGIFFLVVFLAINLLLHVNDLSIGKFEGGFLLSRPGAGVLALMTFIYYMYIYLYFNQSILYKILLVFSFSIAVIYIIFTGSKTAGFGLVAMFFLYIIKNFSLNIKNIIFIVISLSVFFLFIPLSYFSDFIKFYQGDELSSSIERFIEWHVSIDVFKDNYLFGIGWKHYASLINNSINLYGRELFPNIAWKYIILNGDGSSQNVFLDNMAIYGLLGIFYNFFIIFLLYKVYHIDTAKSYILLFLIILLIVNNFHFGNGYEPIFWFLISLVFLKDKILKIRMDV